MLNVLVDVINQLQIADGIFSSELAKETAYYQYQHMLLKEMYIARPIN